MVFIANATMHSISNSEELKRMMKKGFEQRHFAGTHLNVESSRSHLILSILIENTDLQIGSVA